MGSFYSIPHNEADPNDQYHLYFYTTEREIVNWFKLLHGFPPLVESEVKSTQTDSIELKTDNYREETKDLVQIVEKKIVMINQAVQCIEVQPTLFSKKKQKGLFASWFSKKKK